MGLCVFVLALACKTWPLYVLQSAKIFQILHKSNIQSTSFKFIRFIIWVMKLSPRKSENLSHVERFDNIVWFKTKCSVRIQIRIFLGEGFEMFIKIWPVFREISKPSKFRCFEANSRTTAIVYWNIKVTSSKYIRCLWVTHTGIIPSQIIYRFGNKIKKTWVIRNYEKSNNNLESAGSWHPQITGKNSSRLNVYYEAM